MMAGHPDDQAYASWRGPILGAATAAHIDSTHSITVKGYVTNFSGIQATLFNTGAFSGIFMVATFYTDATLAQFTGQKQWQLSKAQDIDCIMPSKGNYVVITLSTSDAVGGNVSYAFTPTNLAAPATRYNGVQSVVTGNAVSIPASTVVTSFPGFLAEGPGYWFLNDHNGSGKIQGGPCLIDVNGNPGTFLGFKIATVQAQSGSLIAPDFAIGMFIQNTDTVAHPADWYLSVDGR